MVAERLSNTLTYPILFTTRKPHIETEINDEKFPSLISDGLMMAHLEKSTLKIINALEMDL